MSLKAFCTPSERIPAGIRFRPIQDTDLEFLSELYASTRSEEMRLIDWSDEQKQTFLQMQFDAQHKFYTEQFVQAEFLLIEDQDQPIGRIYIDRRNDEIRLIDIALIPEQRSQGLGAILLQEVLSEARQRDLPVRIHVEKQNPAMRLYLRLGFQPIEDQGVYDLMEWQPT